MGTAVTRTIRLGTVALLLLAGPLGLPQTQAGAERPAAGRQLQLALTRDGWVRSAGHDGAIAVTRQGLVARGGAWTNGRKVKGRRDGNHLRSRQSFDLPHGGDIRMRFSVDAGGKYLALYPTLFSGVAMRHLSTHNSWAGSVVIPERTWLFAHLHIAPSGDYRIAVARGNFADRGGTLLDQAHGRLTRRQGQVELRFVDNYAGTAASVLIGEAWVTLPPPAAAPPAPMPQPAPASRPPPADPFGALGFPDEDALELRRK